MMIDLIV